MGPTCCAGGGVINSWLPWGIVCLVWMVVVFTWVGLRGGLGDYHYARTRPASRSMNAVRPCCVIEPSPGDPLVTARVHGALSAVPSNRYLGEYTPVLYCTCIFPKPGILARS